MKISKENIRFIVARFFIIAVGLVFIIASLLKALHPVGFADQIALYGLTPESWSVALAWILITFEFVLAIALVLNILPKYSIPLMIMVLLLFTSATVYTIDKNLNNCGCFGSLIHRSPTQVIVEDAIMIAVMLFSYTAVIRRGIGMVGVSRKTAIITSTVFIILVTGFHRFLPVDSFVTELRPGVQFHSWPIENLPLDLEKDKRVVVLFTIHDELIADHISKINNIAQLNTISPTVGLIVDGVPHQTTLIFEYGVAFPTGAIEPRFAKTLYRSLPRTFILTNGKVTSTWNRIPDIDELLIALQSK